jgi:hypothetical protein
LEVAFCGGREQSEWVCAMDRLMMAQQRRLPDQEVPLMTRWRWRELKDVAKAAPATLAHSRLLWLAPLKRFRRVDPSVS